MTRTFCKVMGAMLLLLGFVGFAEPNLLGMHLTTAHNVIHILSGTAALCVGFAGPLSAPHSFSVAFGSAYLVLGVLGFALPGLVGLLIGHGEGVNAAALVPDNLAHVLLGGLFLFFGLMAPAGADRPFKEGVLS
jgi:hypothetical protein